MRAFPYIEAVYGIGYIGPYRTGATLQLGGVEEALFRYEDGDAMTPQLVDSWSIDTFGTTLTMHLEQGIKWQSPRGFEGVDFGEFDAYELVEWLNRSNATTNPSSTYGDAGDLAAIFLGASATSKYTVEVGLVAPVYFCVPLSQFGCLSAARGPHKVTTVETRGIEWARAHHIGTGPYVQGDCSPGDSCTIHAVEDHWRQTANVAEITGIQIPFADNQIAALRNGVVDMASIDYQLLPDVIDGVELRFLETMTDAFVGQSVIFSGNLWEEYHARTGEPLEPWNSPAYNVDWPWIGDPWQETHPQNVRYADNNNPPGMTDMEQARLVRLALSTAIDRDYINDWHLGGIGIPIYSEYMGPYYPGWDPDRTTGCFDVYGSRIACTGAMGPVQWELDDADLTEADRLLELAGYPLVNGTRQSFQLLALQSYPAEAGPVSIDIASTITSDWGALGIPILSLPEDYASVISPRMRQRTQYYPILKNGDIHSNVWPLDWPMPPVDTSSSRPGWGVGFESPAAANWLFQIIGERDRDIRIQKHLTWVDYSMFWVQYAGVIQVPKGIVVNSRIDSWHGYQQHYSNVSSNPEFIVLR